MPSGLQHTPHAQRLGNLKIVDRIPDHNSLRRYGTALLQFSQISQADFHFAAGVNIIQPQQAVKVGAHSALRDLLFQNRQVGSRKNDLLHPGTFQKGKGGHSTFCQRAGPGAGQVILHVIIGKLFVGVFGKIEPCANIIIFNREAKNLTVLGKAVLLRVMIDAEQTVERVHTKGNIIQQGAVPVP